MDRANQRTPATALRGDVRSPAQLALLLLAERLAAFLARHWIPVAAYCGGLLLLADTYHTADPFYLASFCLLIGLVGTRPAGPAVVRGFVWSYAATIAVAGLCAAYSQWTFGTPMSTPDATTFLTMILPQPPYFDRAELLLMINAPLAIEIWQWLFRAVLAAGLEFGAWIGVLANCFLVGLCGALTVLAGRELFGDDPVRLRRIGWLYALNGMILLYGAIFLRDCFLLCINTLLFWLLLRLVSRPSRRGGLATAVILGLSLYAMYWLRRPTVPLLLFFTLLGVTCWFWRKRLTLTRLCAAGAVLLLLFALFAQARGYVDVVLGTILERADVYAEVGYLGAREGSLGMALIVSQPLPIRLPLGFLYMLINPIPLWGPIGAGALEYHLLKVWHGVYMVAITPLAIGGVLIGLRRALGRRCEGMRALFVTAYALVAFAGVVITSLETRHLGQFMPACVLLAAWPDPRSREVGRLRVLWFSLVALVHLAWAVLRFL